MSERDLYGCRMVRTDSGLLSLLLFLGGCCYRQVVLILTVGRLFTVAAWQSGCVCPSASLITTYRAWRLFGAWRRHASRRGFPCRCPKLWRGLWEPEQVGSRWT